MDYSWNKKFLVINLEWSSTLLTEGKIYEVKDGKIICDEGQIIPFRQNQYITNEYDFFEYFGGSNPDIEVFSRSKGRECEVALIS